MRDWEDIAGRPARVASAPAASAGARVGGRRISWTEFEQVTGRQRPVGAADRDRTPRALNLPPAPKPRIPVASNDNIPPAPVVPKTKSTPNRIATALAKSSPALYRTLCRLRELTRPAELDHAEVVLAAANSNAKDETGFGIEYRHDLDPGNVEDLIAAYADGMRSRVVIHRNGTVERFEGGIKFHCADDGTDEIVEVGGRSSRGKFFGLRAHRGVITAYAKSGKRVTPSYDIGDARGRNDAEMPRETTASAAAHPALAELDRAGAFADFCARVAPETERLLHIILEADDFQEVARASNMKPTAHNGRRVTEKILGEVEKLLAA